MRRIEISRRGFVGLGASLAVGGLTGARSAAALPRRADAPRHFVLIHGAWHGAWCWYKVAPLLERAGHQVTAIDLPSAGIDDTPPATVTLQGQVDHVVALLDSLAEPVVLVGHSAAGAVVSMVADARPQWIEKLVFLTAFLLPSGSSIATATLGDTGSLVSAHLVFGPDGTFDVDRAFRRDIFYGQCDDRDVSLAQSLLKPIGARTTIDPIATGSAFQGVRRFYVTCLHDHAISPGLQRAMYTALPCEQVLSIGSDHSPFLSHPTAVVRALAKIAAA
jgi:pimeloyl-ACP methyl ester carboxylesterase